MMFVTVAAEFAAVAETVDEDEKDADWPAEEFLPEGVESKRAGSMRRCYV